jgi:hypothetical protein
MQTPVHAGGHDYPAVRDRGAGFSLAAQARGKEPAPGSAIPANRQSLPGGWLVGDNRNGTVVPHPVEKWPPIRGRVDVAHRRQRVAMTIVIIQRITAMVPMPVCASLGRAGDRERGHCKGRNRSQDYDCLHHRFSKTALNQTNGIDQRHKPQLSRSPSAQFGRYRLAIRSPSHLSAGIPRDVLLLESGLQGSGLTGRRAIL